jgi:hypothetical protein
MDETEKNNFELSPSSSQSGGLLMMSPAAHYRTKVGNKTYSSGTMYAPLTSAYVMSPSFGVASGFPMSETFDYGRASNGAIGFPYQVVHRALASVIPSIGVPNFLGGQTHTSLVDEAIKMMNKTQRKKFVKKICSDMTNWGPYSVLRMNEPFCENQARQYFKLGSNNDDDDDEDDEDDDDEGKLSFNSKNYSLVMPIIILNYTNAGSSELNENYVVATNTSSFETMKTTDADADLDGSDMSKIKMVMRRILRKNYNIKAPDDLKVFALGAEKENKKNVLPIVLLTTTSDRGIFERLKQHFNGKIANIKLVSLTGDAHRLYEAALKKFSNYYNYNAYTDASKLQFTT